ncbi:alpha/beta fold hydrolase [Sphingomonas sp. AOB5]|uniref:alpha/beta fold hydrolase n=1 Tax=Sphingomonas sp. AOB5 TaxID=3034017 RepID=UPI0023F80881|nr:alpha/beta fold hydrolase [Sphingomonas sp. AOB5]MDF7774132.1 alpha/beta fold hydrolase [Sphingomonas sp. AOB5]
MTRLLALLALLFAALPAAAQPWPTKEGDFVIRDFRFRTGETLPELRIHYTTLGTPHRGKDGKIDNAVMVLHGTGGTGKQFLVPQFADELYGPGAPLDITKYYVILPDNIGHGMSSRPSDGLRMGFPKYDYDDMVEAQRRLLVDGLGVDSLQLILGTSMGCMHAFMWGTEHPGFAKRLAPFACQPVEIAGRNRMWRKMILDAIQADPVWNGGNYTAQPPNGLRTAAYLSVIAGGNPVALQANFPTRAKAEEALAAAFASRGAGVDANNALYYYDASRTYDPSPGLERITVPVLWINSADDFINPPELGIAEREVKRMPRARFILIPASAETKGHGTHTWAKFWKAELAELLATNP